MRIRSYASLLTVLGALVAGCGQPDAAGGKPSATPTAVAAPAATASASASSATASSATVSATASAESDEDDAEIKDWGCGRKGQDHCPMQGWMKENVSSAVSKADTAALAKALEFVAKHPVAGYDDWTKIAEEGAKVAASGDLKGAKQSCKSCHKLYQKQYKATLRDQPWPGDGG